ncbi:glycosyltransferase [Antrihabitans cavernicola]|uniref:Glycosyltransferase family 1 protein n=1 Tax=Antrihabitans cavernicola TaxID=2495913 RepID=A0A5A7S4B4_9NOCA|nr:glycosyltransferase [Spelaeibacter cavernicola]KAA0021020.1 glycosyltransferase family 1 protein [Spelaeibacter cavernicola]
MTRIVIVAFGSRGDVAPFTGLGVRLRSAGYTVAIAAMAAHADLVTDAGLEYRFLPKDMEEESRSELSQQLIEGTAMRPSRKQLAEMVDSMRGMGPAIVEAARGADVLLLNATGSMFGFHVAEGLGIPSMGVFMQPMAPTGEFPPSVIGTRSLGRWGNRTLGKLAALGDKPFLGQINEVRAAVGLRPTTVKEYAPRRNTTWPIMHGFSPTVVPRPSDWRPGLEVAGFWWPELPTRWEPPAELADFIDAGAPPVYVGFGSTATNDGERYSDIIGAALRKAGVRGVVQSGWAKLHCTGDDVITIDEIPHRWLFPQMSAVVHHCGAGTTAAGLQAGVPTVPVTGIMDQPFWAKRLTTLGVAPTAIRRKEVDADTLADAITRAVSEPRFRTRAKEVSAALAHEDGAGAVVDAVEALCAHEACWET